MDNQSSRRHITPSRLTTSLVFVVVLAACSAPAARLQGTVFSPPKPAAEFRLTDQNGRPFELSQARGQLVTLYFGFTHCKDVCPQTLVLLSKARALAKLSPGQARIIMITVDPKADTPPALRAFFGKLHVNATGLTGPRTTLAAVYKSYGIAVEPQNHDIAHTDVIFLIDSKGAIREILDPETSPASMAADMRALSKG